MAFINDHYLKLAAGYLFPEIARRVTAFADANPSLKGRIIRCGIGDVTEPLPAVAIEAMHGIKREAVVMKECLLRGDFAGIVSSLKEGWANKKRSSQAVSNAQMDQIFDTAIQAGALAGKISGAGGGGFILFFVPTERRMDVVRSLRDSQGYVTNCHFTKHGSQAWKA